AEVLLNLFPELFELCRVSGSPSGLEHLGRRHPNLSLATANGSEYAGSKNRKECVAEGRFSGHCNCRSVPHYAGMPANVACVRWASSGLDEERAKLRILTQF